MNRKLLFVLFLLVAWLPMRGQVLIYSEGFETNGEGTRYTTNTYIDCPNSDFFFRTNTNPVTPPTCSAFFQTALTNLQGSFFWASEDIRTSTPSPLSLPPGFITTQAINVSGYATLTVSLYLATSGNNNTRWESSDSINIQASIDGGAFRTVGRFMGKDMTPLVGARLGIDGNLDGVYTAGVDPAADCDVANFTQYTFSIPGTGNSLAIKLDFDQVGGSEELAIDQIEVRGVLQPCTSPTITCPATQLLPLNGSCQATLPDYTGLASVGGACSPTVTQNPAIGAAQSGTGSLSVVLTATNTASQTATCIFTVTKTDNLAPTITCPSNISSNTDPGVCSATVSFTNPSGADNCSGSTTTQIAGLASGSTFPAGNTTNTFRVTDASGNTATCSFTVDVTDNELPTIVCPPNLVISTAANSCDAVVNYTMPTGADNCGISQVTLGIGLASGSAFPMGTTNTTLIASDLGSNVSSCNFSVLVVDSVAPTAVCQNLTLTLDANGAATLLPSAIGGGSSDNCFLTGLALSVTSFTCTDIGSNLVVLTATDSAGNTSTCSAQVLVSDVTSPNVICQNDTLYLDQQGNATVNLAALDGGSTDNCGIASLQANPNSFTTNDVGSNNVTVTFTDLGGNTTACVSVVEVIDTFITAIGLPVGNGIQLIAAPNPAFDRLQVQVHCTACLPGDALQLELWGMTGQRLQTRELAGGLQNQEIELNLSGLPAGNYLLGLRHNNGFISQRILKY